MSFGQFVAGALAGAGAFVVSGGNPIAAVAGAKAGADFVGGLEEKKEKRQQAKQQQAFGQQQLALSQGIAQQTRETGQQAALQFQPFQEAGQQALQERQALLGFGTPEQQAAAQQRIQQNPDFQFQRQAGEGAIDRAAAARGRLNSGRTLMQLRSFNTELAANAFNRRQQSLATPIQQGQTSTIAATNALTGAQSQSANQQLLGSQLNAQQQQAALLSQQQGNQAGRQGVTSAIDTGITALSATGALDEKPQFTNEVQNVFAGGR